MLLGEAEVVCWGALLSGVNLSDKPWRMDSSLKSIFPLSYLEKRFITAEVEGCRLKGHLSSHETCWFFPQSAFSPRSALEDEREQVFLFYPRNSVNLFHWLIFFLQPVFSTCKL